MSAPFALPPSLPLLPFPPLPPELTIYAVGALREQWLARLGKAAEVEACLIDGAAVDQVDAAGVQALLSLSKALAARRCRLRVARPSTSLTRALEDLGVSDVLDAPNAPQEGAR